MSEVLAMPETVCLYNCENVISVKWYKNSDSAVKWAARKFILPEKIGAVAYIRTDLANDFCKIKNQEIQIEKMKNCFNCSHEMCLYECECEDDCFCIECKKNSKWELKK